MMVRVDYHKITLLQVSAGERKISGLTSGQRILFICLFVRLFVSFFIYFFILFFIYFIYLFSYVFIIYIY